MHLNVTEPPSPNLEDLPTAVSSRSLSARLPLVWILPAVVILAGAFVVIYEKLRPGNGDRDHLPQR